MSLVVGIEGRAVEVLDRVSRSKRRNSALMQITRVIVFSEYSEDDLSRAMVDRDDILLIGIWLKSGGCAQWLVKPGQKVYRWV